MHRVLLFVLLAAFKQRVDGRIRLKLYKGLVRVVGRASPDSLYSQAHVTFEEDRSTTSTTPKVLSASTRCAWQRGEAFNSSGGRAMPYHGWVRRWALVAFCCTTSAGPVAAQAVVADLPIPSGGTERAAFIAARQGRATVVLLAGGDGTVPIDNAGNTGSQNFLIRTRMMWPAYGINAVILGSPNGASLLGQRSQPGYAGALGAAVDFARSRANVPVWLVGTSMGSIAAVNGAARLGGKVAGVVLTSSVTQPNRSGETAFSAGASSVAVPVLVISNTGDTCRASPPGDAQNLANAMAASPRKQVILVASSAIQGDPCEALSPHGYLGIEGSVVQQIASWISGAPGN